MPPISVVIITFNEEKNIERCLRSVQGMADEIIVLDSLSTDRTKEICQQYKAKFIEQPFLGYVEQKNKALEFATYSHVLSLDADEVLTEELRNSILEIKENWLPPSGIIQCNHQQRQKKTPLQQCDLFPQQVYLQLGKPERSGKNHLQHSEYRAPPDG